MTTDDAPRPALDAATRERLADLERKAEPGPWIIHEDSDSDEDDGPIGYFPTGIWRETELGHDKAVIEYAEFGGDGEQQALHAEFIVAMRNALPVLLAAAARADALAGEVERLRAALEWYANQANYENYDEQGWYQRHSNAEYDEGKRARAALAPASGEGGGDGD